jgi:hypothetical protein
MRFSGIQGERIETMGKALEQQLQELREMLLVAVSQADDAYKMATGNPYSAETAKDSGDVRHGTALHVEHVADSQRHAAQEKAPGRSQGRRRNVDELRGRIGEKVRVGTLSEGRHDHVGELKDVDATGVLLTVKGDDYTTLVLRFIPWSNVDYIEFPVEHAT